MTHHVDAAAAWIYRGVWASVVGFFKVPEEPSTLPAIGEPVRSLRPAPGYLRVGGERCGALRDEHLFDVGHAENARHLCVKFRDQLGWQACGRHDALP